MGVSIKNSEKPHTLMTIPAVMASQSSVRLTSKGRQTWKSTSRPTLASRMADMVDRSASEKPKTAVKIWMPMSSNRSVRPPGRARAMTLGRKCPLVRL